MKDNTTNAVRLARVSPDQAGQRIDNYLLRELKGVPKSHIYRLLRRGEVRVNKGRSKPEYRLVEGDLVRIPPVRTAVRDATSPREGLLQRIESAIIHEDERVLILNKPSGMAVHGGSGIQHGVIEALRAARPKAPFLELVHRLDRETSGCLVIAKKRSALRNLHELLRTGQVEKQYLALVKAPWRKGKQTVTAALRKNQLKGGERIVEVDAAGKPARTLFTPRNHYPAATLLEVDLDTGRTHQIRVHAQHLGFPLAGDEKYGDATFNRMLRAYGLRRLFLHAHRLRFQESVDHPVIEVLAPLDPALQQVLDSLQQEAQKPPLRSEG